MNTVTEQLNLADRVANEIAVIPDNIIENVASHTHAVGSTYKETVQKVGIKCAVKSCNNRRPQNVLDSLGNVLRWFSFPFEHKRFLYLIFIKIMN